jgi:hypothetical protein
VLVLPEKKGAGIPAAAKKMTFENKEINFENCTKNG